MKCREIGGCMFCDLQGKSLQLFTVSSVEGAMEGAMKPGNIGAIHFSPCLISSLRMARTMAVALA